MRPPSIRIGLDELVVDSFAGGGGASTGIEAALGRNVDIAINHSPEAIAVHAANHPRTKHYLCNVWEVDPVEACAGRPVGLMWASPDCTHFSRAKGAAPKSAKTRSLASVVIRWARAVRPRVICLENVEEFETWGPLDNEGKPIPEKAGRSFRIWLGKLRAQGYQVEWRSLVAADYGAPTTRKRLFLVARCDGAPIQWPSISHPRPQWRAAHEVIDWSLPCPSIFGRDLAEATLQRIADGIRRHVIESANPFVVRGVGTVTAHAIAKHYGGGPNGNNNAGTAMTSPLGTITAVDHHALLGATLRHAQLPLAFGERSDAVHALLLKYYGSGGQQQSLWEPLHTVTAVARFALVTVHGQPYRITDIGMRMLEPHELFAGNGFPRTYDIAPLFNGKRLSKKAQTRLAGNSVCPPMAEALVEANVGGEQRTVAA
jgi:DNA (cytosine-5)-methyltransferase 1